MLNGDVEGKVIMGKYKKRKILLDRRLKQFVIKKVIEENPIKYK